MDSRSWSGVGRGLAGGALLALALAWTACGSAAPGSGGRADGGLPFGMEDGGTASEDGGGEPPDAGIEAPREALVRGLAISQIALYQGIKIPIMKDGNPTERPTNPVVQGRAGLLTVFVTPGSGYRARTVKGILEVRRGDQLIERLENERRITAPSRDADLSSMFSFNLTTDHVTDDFRYRVELRETTTDETFDGADDRATFPAEGTAHVQTKWAGARMRVVIVPMRYNADRSGREPDTSDAAVERYRALMLATYPVPDVEVTVHEPVDISDTITAAGRGWSETLDFLLRLRQDDGIDDDIYYYGVFNPSRSFSTYCSQGCILGLSSGSADPRLSVLRGSIGVGYAGEPGYAPESTFVHEIGHAHGRLHAPCGLDGQPADRGFPYSTGGVGTWGLDPRSRRMLDPARTKDFMSYCDPSWISDYTYRALFERVKQVNDLAGQPKLASAPDGRRAFRMLRKTEDGLALGSKVLLAPSAVGETLRVERGTHGRALGSVTAQFFPYDHLPGGIVLIEESALVDVHELAIGAHPLRMPTRLGH